MDLVTAHPKHQVDPPVLSPSQTSTGRGTKNGRTIALESCGDPHPTVCDQETKLCHREPLICESTCYSWPDTPSPASVQLPAGLTQEPPSKPGQKPSSMPRPQLPPHSRHVTVGLLGHVSTSPSLDSTELKPWKDRGLANCIEVTAGPGREEGRVSKC